MNGSARKVKLYGWYLVAMHLGLIPVHLLAEVPATAATSAPWWGVPVIAGGFLLLGGALGGWISFASTRAADHRKSKREDAVRWYDDIRQLSAEAIATARAIKHQAGVQLVIIGTEGGRVPSRDDSFEESRAAVIDSMTKLRELQGRMDLIAPRRIRYAFQDLIVSMRATGPRNQASLEEALPEIQQAIDLFSETVRACLKVTD